MSTTVYRIKEWAERFETHQTRGRIKGAMPWIRMQTVPGLSYRRLMREPKGAEAYGCFIALILVAARLSPRGVLAKDGKPLSVTDLEDLTDIPEGTMLEAIDVLSSERIGWLLSDGDRADLAPERAEIGVDRAEIDLERAEKATDRADTAQKSSNLRDRIEKNRIEKNRGGSAQTIEADGADPGSTTHPRPEDAWKFERSQNWVTLLRPIVGSKLGPKNWQEWKRLVNKYPVDDICEAAESAAPDRRWPSEVETALIEMAPQTPAIPEYDPKRTPEHIAACAMIDRIGWQAAVKILGFLPGKINSDETLRRVLAGNIPACVELLAPATKA